MTTSRQDLVLAPDVSPLREPVSDEMTDGFHLFVDAFKLNDVGTIYEVHGIPITDLARLAQASGIRFISFQHESSAGPPAGAAGFLNKGTGCVFDGFGTGVPQRTGRVGQREHQPLSYYFDLRIKQEANCK